MWYRKHTEGYLAKEIREDICLGKLGRIFGKGNKRECDLRVLFLLIKDLTLVPITDFCLVNYEKNFIASNMFSAICFSVMRYARFVIMIAI